MKSEKEKKTPRWMPVPKHAGVFVWHEVKKTPDGPKPCGAYNGGRCRCNPKFRGEVWNPDTKRPDKQSPAVPNVNEAIGWVADYRRGLAAPEPVNTTGVLVEEFHAAFIKAARAGHALAKGKRRYSQDTLDHYARDFRHHVAPHVKGKTTTQMDASAWQIVVVKIAERGALDSEGNPTGKPLAESTIVGIVSGVRAAYRWGAAPSRRIVTSKPLNDVEIPKAAKPKRKRVAPPETIPALIEALRGRRDLRGPNPNPAMRIAWAIMFYAGLRVSEVVALDWSDIADGYITVGETKTDAGTYRQIPIAAPLAAILDEWKKERGGFPIGPVCPGTKTFRATDSGISDAGKKRWTAAGLPVYAPHEARHTFASTVIASRDVSLADLKEWMGHASLATTDAYVKTLPGYRQQSAGARISGAFG